MENQYNYYNPENPQRTYQNYSQPEQHNMNHGNKPKKKMPKAVAVVGLALLFGIVSSATFLTSNIVGSKILGLDNSSSAKAETKQNAPVGSSLSKSSTVVTSDVSSTVESVMPSVVSITNLSVQEVQSFFGGRSQMEMKSAGTGIIVSQTDEEFLIVTNYHVIKGSETLTVTFNDESSVEAGVKGSDADHDVAVIAVPKSQLSDETMNAISVATLGDSTKLKVGEPAIAIGNALGYGQSVTVGVISAVDREAPSMDESTGEVIGSAVKKIQTDAAINEGNSGGALINVSGEVIGINSSKLAGTRIEGMGYAIPISDVSDIIDRLMNQRTKHKVEESRQGILGVRGYDVTAEISQKFQMPLGYYVYELVEGGGAEQAGITQGNIITGINGSSVTCFEELQKELTYYAAGDTVTVTVQIPENNGEYTERQVDVTLGEREQTPRS